jgi:hypothetical protein
MKNPQDMDFMDYMSYQHKTKGIKGMVRATLKWLIYSSKAPLDNSNTTIAIYDDIVSSRHPIHKSWDAVHKDKKQ